MYRSGLIFGVLTLFVAAGATLISPLCAPCAVVFLGLGAGYVAGVFDTPSTSNKATIAGAVGGAVSGVGALLGQAAGAWINSAMLGPQGAEQIYQAFGIPSSGPNFVQAYWVGLIGGTLCISLIDILLMAAFGALGAFLWWQTTGKKAVAPSTPAFPG